jgi:hypothetical protein
MDASVTTKNGRENCSISICLYGINFYRLHSLVCAAATWKLIIKDGVVEHVFYPVFPPDQNAADVLGWLEKRCAK